MEAVGGAAGRWIAPGGVLGSCACGEAPHLIAASGHGGAPPPHRQALGAQGPRPGSDDRHLQCRFSLEQKRKLPVSGGHTPLHRHSGHRLFATESLAQQATRDTKPRLRMSTAGSVLRILSMPIVGHISQHRNFFRNAISSISRANCPARAESESSSRRGRPGNIPSTLSAMCQRPHVSRSCRREASTTERQK